jgi:hypothetical protein
MEMEENEQANVWIGRNQSRRSFESDSQTLDQTDRKSVRVMFALRDIVERDKQAKWRSGDGLGHVRHSNGVRNSLFVVKILHTGPRTGKGIALWLRGGIYFMMARGAALVCRLVSSEEGDERRELDDDVNVRLQSNLGDLRGFV